MDYICYVVSKMQRVVCSLLTVEVKILFKSLDTAQTLFTDCIDKTKATPKY